MTATRYTDILESALVPFLQEVFLDGHWFQQDNDLKHCARHTKAFFETENINLWATTPESPDLNPIENVWGSMKQFLRNDYNPKGLDDLKKGIKHFWKKLTPAVCTHYINHLHHVMPVVIEKGGGPSGF